jgi:glycosyltransferase involved in cell wall biosynthesis
MTPAKSNPTVSVIIATYNRSNVLRCALQSVLWQTFQDFDVWVIGDHCTDDSAEVVASLDDERIHWHNLPENSGHQSQPNNTGIERSRGQYIAYLGHDDIWHPTHLEKLVAGVEAAQADLGTSLCNLIGRDGKRGLMGIQHDSAPFNSGLISPSAVLHTRVVIDAVGGWHDYRAVTTTPDAELWLRIHLAEKRLITVPELTVFKFPAAWQRDVYRDKSADQQLELMRRIETEPDFIEREWQALALAFFHGHIGGGTLPKKPAIVPRGWQIEQRRRIRGLPPRDIPRVTLREYGRYAFSQVYKRIPSWLRLRQQWRRWRGQSFNREG